MAQTARTLTTGLLITGVITSTATWAAPQMSPSTAMPAAPSTANKAVPAQSATAFPSMPLAGTKVKSPQLSRVDAASPVGTIIYAINAERGLTVSPTHRVRWRPVSTLPAPERAAQDRIPQDRALLAQKNPVVQLPAKADTKTDAVAPVNSKLPARPAPSQDRVLLAELEADLLRTQRRLTAADAKLSASQRQLASFTNVLQQAMLDAGPDATGLHPFVRVAKRYAGTPYWWGGESSRGFDCSGFIIRVMRDLGYPPLPHSAAIQFNYGQAIAVPLLKPGDLVFFKGTYKPGVSHVGIYLGRSRFIHAAGTGIGTIVSSLNEPKWRPGGKHYAGARRLIRARA